MDSQEVIPEPKSKLSDSGEHQAALRLIEKHRACRRALEAKVRALKGESEDIPGDQSGPGVWHDQEGKLHLDRRKAQRERTYTAEEWKVLNMSEGPMKP